jgi:hypothetical protein
MKHVAIAIVSDEETIAFFVILIVVTVSSLVWIHAGTVIAIGGIGLVEGVIAEDAIAEDVIAEDVIVEDAIAEDVIAEDVIVIVKRHFRVLRGISRLVVIFIQTFSFLNQTV